MKSGKCLGLAKHPVLIEGDVGGIIVIPATTAANIKCSAMHQCIVGRDFPQSIQLKNIFFEDKHTPLGFMFHNMLINVFSNQVLVV